MAMDARRYPPRRSQTDAGLWRHPHVRTRGNGAARKAFVRLMLRRSIYVVHKIKREVIKMITAGRRWIEATRLITATVTGDKTKPQESRDCQNQGIIPELGSLSSC